MTVGRTAIIHEWLTTWAGSEQVVEQLLVCHPQADVLALIDRLTPAERRRLGGARVIPSLVDRLPLAERWFRAWPPLLAYAVEQHDVASYDLVVSSSHCVAKGVRVRPDALHLCYCHSPMRYAWDMQERYLREAGLASGWRGAVFGPVIRRMLGRMRDWDVRSAAGVDAFVANSRYVAQRIARVWRRPAVVVHPPVDVAAFSRQDAKGDYWLAASRLVPYKGMDVIVEAFKRMPQHRLVVIGDGPQRGRIEALARGCDNIDVRGYVPRPDLVAAMQGAKGFLFSAEEDFGIAPVEAMACGTPVLALGRGGALESVVDGVTGRFFPEPTAESLIAAFPGFAATTWDPAACRARAEEFSQERFRAAWHRVVALAQEARSIQIRESRSQWDDRFIERHLLASWKDSLPCSPR